MKALAQAVSLVKSNHYFKSGVVWLIFGAFIFVSMHQNQKAPVVTQAPVEVSAKTDETTKLMARQLQEIQTQLANLKQEVEKPKKTVNLGVQAQTPVIYGQDLIIPELFKLHCCNFSVSNSVLDVFMT